jgi:hypothetical protein
VTASPVMTRITSHCRMWIAYWRLRPLWAAMLQAVPYVRLRADQGSGFGIRWRLLRRVVEIRDAELALRPYWRGDVAARASVAARSAGLSNDLQVAVVEAAVVMDAVDACVRGMPLPSRTPTFEQLWLAAGDDLQSEAARLVRVSQVINRCPIVQDIR